LILLAGVYYGAIFGGSTSSILLNAPGVASTVATSFDGYPMARQGKAGKALTIAAMASFAGGTIGAVLLMIFAPALSTVALLFHSAEYFALMVVGLSADRSLRRNGPGRQGTSDDDPGLIMATVGEGALFNMPRFTMGLMDLQSGFGFITLAMAMFALPEALFLVLDPNAFENREGATRSRICRITGGSQGDRPVIGRQSMQGFFIGVLPGAGRRSHPSSATRWSATSQPRRNRRVRQRLRQGAGRAGERQQRGLHRLLRAAPDPWYSRIRHNGDPAGCTDRAQRHAGATFDGRQPEIFWAVIISMYLGNVVLLILNLPLIPYIAKILASRATS
jgi:putative tricarboxylic transport membrane protein